MVKISDLESDLNQRKASLDEMSKTLTEKEEKLSVNERKLKEKEDECREKEEMVIILQDQLNQVFICLHFLSLLADVVLRPMQPMQL